jgi:hypothetical protein
MWGEEPGVVEGIEGIIEPDAPSRTSSVRAKRLGVKTVIASRTGKKGTKKEMGTGRLRVKSVRVKTLTAMENERNGKNGKKVRKIG